jgi:UDP:flavonoid glycosyltransferase YjiC (YdhE family)
MSRFLFATFGSLGDLHPYIAVSRELVNRGHEAVIVGVDGHRDVVEAAGIEFGAIASGRSELVDYETMVTRIFDVRLGLKYLMSNLVMPYLEIAYHYLLEASEGADLLVSHPLAVSLPLVAERRHLPWVSTVLSPMSLLSRRDPPVIAAAPWLQKLGPVGSGVYRLLFTLLKKSARNWEAPLQDFRRRHGFRASSDLALFEGQFSPLCNLALFDPQLAHPQPDWPKNTRVCGSPVFDGKAPDQEVINELQEFLRAGDPPIVFALGSSVAWIAGEFWQRAIEAVTHLGKRAILITGPQRPASSSADVKVFSALPYSMVFPHATVIVHQGGIGTLSQALRSGHPQLIVPLGFDQPDNAERAVALGLGKVLMFRSLTSQKITSALDELLNNSRYARAASNVASELKEANGAARTAIELVRCLSGSPDRHA